MKKGGMCYGSISYGNYKKNLISYTCVDGLGSESSLNVYGLINPPTDDMLSMIDYYGANPVYTGNGDGGSAAFAKLNAPHGLDIDVDGNIWIADAGSNRIRVIYKRKGPFEESPQNFTCDNGADNCFF